MNRPSVRAVDFGYFVRPASETSTGSSSVEPCQGYLVDDADGLVLMDTGMGSDREVDAYYLPNRPSLARPSATPVLSPTIFA